MDLLLRKEQEYTHRTAILIVFLAVNEAVSIERHRKPIASPQNKPVWKIARSLPPARKKCCCLRFHQQLSLEDDRANKLVQ